MKTPLHASNVKVIVWIGGLSLGIAACGPGEGVGADAGTADAGTHGGSGADTTDGSPGSDTTSGAGSESVGDGDVSTGSEDSSTGDGVPADVTRVPAFFRPHGIFVEVQLDGISVLMQYDTGAPMAILDRAAAMATGLDVPGQGTTVQMTTEIGDRSLGERPVYFMDLALVATPYPNLPGPIVGLIGNAFFDGLVIGLDPRGEEIWISPAQPPEAGVPAPPDTGAALHLPFEQTLDYLEVECGFADGWSGRCLFDTGAPTTLVFQRHWDELPHPSDRLVPTLFGDAMGQVRQGYYQRTSAAAIGDALAPTGEFVLVGDFDWFDSFCTRSISPDCIGIVGVHNFQGHYTAIDYENDRVLFFPYEDWDAPPDPFDGFGFLLTQEPASTELLVGAVAPQSHAEAVGVAEGDVLEEIDGQPWQTVRFETIDFSSYVAGEVGDTRSFTFARGDDQVTLEVEAENLLPPLMGNLRRPPARAQPRGPAPGGPMPASGLVRVGEVGVRPVAQAAAPRGRSSRRFGPPARGSSLRAP